MSQAGSWVSSAPPPVPRCLRQSIGQDASNVRHGIGGTRAVCDGMEHRWENTGKPQPDTLDAGTAHFEATLMERSGPRTACCCPASTPPGAWTSR